MSISAKILRSTLRLMQFKKLIHRAFQKPPRNTGAMRPGRFRGRFRLESWSIDGFQLLSLHQETPTDKHLLFLHGGGYVIEASAFHRKFLETLASEHGLELTYLDYPKAPEYTFETTVKWVEKVYRQIIAKHPEREMILIGDSAGGGLALVILQLLREKGVKPFPQSTILLSPWVDLSMRNPQIPQYAAKDPMLPLEGLIHAGNVYAGGEDLMNPLLSPLFGDMTNLGSILLFVGTHEVLYPDCLAFAEKCLQAQGTTIEVVIGDGMLHDWVIFPLRESREGMRQIVNFIHG